jgi:hypothetical protein
MATVVIAAKPFQFRSDTTPTPWKCVSPTKARVSTQMQYPTQPLLNASKNVAAAVCS